MNGSLSDRLNVVEIARRGEFETDADSPPARARLGRRPSRRPAVTGRPAPGRAPPSLVAARLGALDQSPMGVPAASSSS
jgi:hypothetical protein